MKNLIEYRYSIENLFFKYCTDKFDLQTLILELRQLELYHRNLTQSFNGELWFQFEKGDTLATDISDLEKDLQDGCKNREFTLDKLKQVYSLGGELLIYFS